MFAPVDVLMAYPTGLLTGPCDRSSRHRGRLRRRWGQSDRRESYTGSGWRPSPPGTSAKDIVEL